MYSFVRALCTAHRLGLRDKGPVDWSTDGNLATTLIHSFCRTRIRIGIVKKDGSLVRYCWRCEIIFGDSPPPKGKEPLPVNEQQQKSMVERRLRRVA